jgi:purine-nucleoside phosphorylase
VQKRKSEGCLAVEMEAAGLQAVCDFHALELYDFLEAGDVLEESAYDTKALPGANHSLGKIMVALEIAKRMENYELAGKSGLYLTYTGVYKGARISVVSGGSGAPEVCGRPCMAHRHRGAGRRHLSDPALPAVWIHVHGKVVCIVREISKLE